MKSFLKLGLRSNQIRSYFFISALFYSISFIPTFAEEPAQAPQQSFDYPEMFRLTRELLTRKPVQKFLRETFAEELTISDKLKKELGYPASMKIKSMSESQFVLLLSHFPKLWPMLDEYIKAVPTIKEDNEAQKAKRAEFRKKFKEAIDDKAVLEKFRKLNDPLMPMVLENPKGDGYRNIKFNVSHESRTKDGEIIPASDLVQVWSEFIGKAEKEVMFNVFDFDIESIADQIIEMGKKGIQFTIGIDGVEVKTVEGVKKVYEKLLNQKNINVVAVDSVGLNHQKVITRDWSLGNKAAQLDSSGNLTHSCLDPKGDLWYLPDNQRPAESKPNANHVITMDSELGATLIHHELTKTLEMKLRGGQYPISGAYRIYKDGKFHEPTDLDAPQIILGFSPSGGMTGDINLDIISRLILHTTGPIRMAQFAFSSEPVEAALFERMKLEMRKNGKFDFKGVGENGFAQRDWSVFLSMSGYKMNTDTGEYVLDKDSKWIKGMPAGEFKKLQDAIKAAPSIYRDRKVKVGNDSVSLSSKLHHKVLLTGKWAIVGTSYNFSAGANHNQEQIFITNDPEIVRPAYEMFDGIYSQSEKSLTEAVESKNVYLNKDEEDAKKATTRRELTVPCAKSLKK